MILQVHDELVFDVLNSEIKRVEKIVKEKMENVFTLSIPLIANVGKGKNWFETGE